MISIEQIQYLLGGGGRVVGPDGDKLGNVGHVYLDDQTGNPEWVTVTTGMFGRAASLVPLAEGTLSGDEITVPYDKDKVKDAPQVEDSEDHLTKDQEAQLYRYYGIDHPLAHSGSGIPRSDREPPSGPGSGGAKAPRDEQLLEGTESITTDKARLRKYVDTDSRTHTNPGSP